MSKTKIILSMLLAGIIFPCFSQNRQEPPVSAEPIWEQDMKGKIIALPFLQAESAVVILEEGDVKSYSRTGSWLWTYHAREKLSPHVSRSRQGTTYACTASGKVIAINRVGRELWKIDLKAPITSPIIVGWDGRLFMPVKNRVYCRTASGYLLWTADLGADISVQPVLNHRGGLSMVLSNNKFVLLSHLSHIEEFDLHSAPLHIIPLEIDKAGADSFFVFYRNGAIDYLYRDDKKLVSRALDPLKKMPAAVAQWKDHAAVTLTDGSVVLLSVPDAKVLWTGESHEAASQGGSGHVEPYDAEMQFDERGVYTLSADGVSGFRIEDGARLWVLRIQGSAEIPSFSDEGYLYSGGTDRILHAYHVESRKRDIPRSLYGPKPEGSYGLGSPPPSSWSILPNRFNPKLVQINYDEIKSAVESGNVGEDEPDYVAYIMEVAGISLAPTYQPVRPQVELGMRSDYVLLLGYLGSEETIPFLAKLFTNDKEPIIKAACCDAMGRIGVDPAGDAIRAFTFLLAPDNANLDSTALMAAATATKQLCKFSGPPLDAAGIRLLRAFTATDFPPVVKKHAMSELESLYKK